jgi:hypothetical protein
MLITETLADANHRACSPIADLFLGAIGILSAIGGVTRAIETGGALRTVRMLLAGCELAVRSSTDKGFGTVSGLRAVP